MAKDFNAPRFLLSIIAVVSKLADWVDLFVENPDEVVQYIRKNHHSLRDFKNFPNAEIIRYLTKEARKISPGKA